MLRQISRWTIVLWWMLAASAACASPFRDPLDTAAVPRATSQFARLTAVAVEDDRAIVVGPDGNVLTSEDGGKTWQQRSVPVSSDLVSVRFVTRDKAWAVGHDGVVLHTADGGRTWVKQLDGRQAAKAMLEYYERRSNSGDATATKMLDEAKRFVAEGADKPFFDVLFLNEAEGFAVGAFNLSFRTQNGGKTWEPLNDRTENPKGLHLYGLAVAGGVPYLVGEQGLIRRWNRAQERFDIVESPYKGSFFGAIGKGALLVAFGMRGNAFRSTDGGATWVKMRTNATAGITSGTIMPEGRLVLATYSGLLLVSDYPLETFSAVRATKPMPYAGVAAEGADRVVLVGKSGIRVEVIKKGASQE